MAMIISTIAVVVHFAITHGFKLSGYPAEVYLIGVAMAVICTIIPSFLISEAIRLWGPSNVAIVGSIGPISTILLAGIFLDEKITIFQLLGTILVISGILLLGTNKKILTKTKTNESTIGID